MRLEMHVAGESPPDRPVVGGGSVCRLAGPVVPLRGGCAVRRRGRVGGCDTPGVDN